MTNEELQQLKDLLMKFAGWDCDRKDCAGCPMYPQNKRGLELCHYINVALTKFNKE